MQQLTNTSHLVPEVIQQSQGKKNQLPSSLRREVLINLHDLLTGGHLGVNKTYAKLRDRYFWPKMYMDVQHWCSSCEYCAMKKSPKQRRGAPRVLLSDRGSNFLSSLFREVCFLLNTEKIFTSACRLQTNGLAERSNGTLAQSLSMYVSSNQKDWDEHLNSILFAYRVSPSEVTGESPLYMLYGRE